MLNIVSQDRLIAIVNRYFKENNLPLKFNEEGVCNGLAHVYAQYTLKGEEEKFKKIIQAIASNQLDTLEPGEFDLFFSHVLLSFLPEEYDKKLSQASASFAFGDFRPVFQLGMVLNQKDWIETFNDLNFEENEVMVINTINHTIALTKKNGQYEIYDPNYLFGFHTVKDNDRLVSELQNVFHFRGPNLGLRIQIISKNTNLKESLKHYNKLTNENVNQTASIDNKTTNSLSLALECYNSESIKLLIDKGANLSDQDIQKAIFENNDMVIEYLIRENKIKKELIIPCLIYALKLGRLEVFNKMLLNDEFNQAFEDKILKTNKSLLLNYAAEGGNIELLELVIKKCKEDHSDTNHTLSRSLTKQNQFNGELLGEYSSTLIAAINGRSTECLKRLIDLKDELGIIVKDENKEEFEKIKMDCLQLAIKTNQMFMCKTLLKQIPPANISKIQMSLRLVAKTNVFILKDLQTKGVYFSPSALAIIQKKEHQAIGLLLLIGIELQKFVEYILQKEAIIINNKDFKTTLHEGGEDAQPHESPEETSEETPFLKNDSNKI